MRFRPMSESFKSKISCSFRASRVPEFHPFSIFFSAASFFSFACFLNSAISKRDKIFGTQPQAHFGGWAVGNVTHAGDALGIFSGGGGGGGGGGGADPLPKAGAQIKSELSKLPLLLVVFFSELDVCTLSGSMAALSANLQQVLMFLWHSYFPAEPKSFLIVRSIYFFVGVSFCYLHFWRYLHYLTWIVLDTLSWADGAPSLLWRSPAKQGADGCLSRKKTFPCRCMYFKAKYWNIILGKPY